MVKRRSQFLNSGWENNSEPRPKKRFIQKAKKNTLENIKLATQRAALRCELEFFLTPWRAVTCFLLWVDLQRPVSMPSFLVWKSDWGFQPSICSSLRGNGRSVYCMISYMPGEKRCVWGGYLICMTRDDLEEKTCFMGRS